MLAAERSEMDSRNAPSDEDQREGQQRAEVSEERELLLISHSAGWPRLAQRLNAFCLPPCRQLIEIAKSSIHSFIHHYLLSPQLSHILVTDAGGSLGLSVSVQIILSSLCVPGNGLAACFCSSSNSTGPCVHSVHLLSSSAD